MPGLHKVGMRVREFFGFWCLAAKKLNQAFGAALDYKVSWTVGQKSNMDIKGANI